MKVTREKSRLVAVESASTSFSKVDQVASNLSQLSLREPASKDETFPWVVGE